MKVYNKEEMMGLLKKAQDTYGYKNQISVSTEECCELAQVLAKYVRYPDHNTACISLSDKVLDEIADVLICIQHVHMIFNFTDEQVAYRISKKLERLERWLDKSPDMYQTTKDREV